MRVPRLYCPDLHSGRIRLPPEEARHFLASLRGRTGQEVVVFDGKGAEGSAIVAGVRRRDVEIEVGELRTRPFELAHRITLAVALSKGPRQGYMIEKCTELGVAAIRPIIAERSVARPDPDVREKWFRRGVEAAKQSQRAFVPAIEAPQSLTAAVNSIPLFSASVVTIAHRDGVGLLAFLGGQPAASAILVFVGPEGGWTEDERRLLAGAGATPCSLGPTVLRTETAAVVVCAAAALLGRSATSGGD